jgi:hypothetical protein
VADTATIRRAATIEKALPGGESIGVEKQHE